MDEFGEPGLGLPEGEGPEGLDASPPAYPTDPVAADPAAPGADLPPLPSDLVTFDPEAAPPDTDWLHGEPWTDLQWAQTQTQDGFCVPVSVAMLVSEASGVVHTEAEVVETAVTLGLLTQDGTGTWSGMTAEGARVLLDHYGIDARVDHAAGIETISDHLDEGHGVIVAVDSDEVWHGVDDDPSDAGAAPDHALVVTGVDDARGVVTLNDPGRPDGPGYEVAIATFEDAWADSGMELVVAEAGVAPTPQPGPATDPEESPFPYDFGGDEGPRVIEHMRWVVPIVLAGGLATAFAGRGLRPA